ncbi:hypothetical protein HY628_01430, partial [Candidatus Uhrbacteria bacterium]|nr:hypothetical protein [Candidatus Uhrbacteria bacterium]
MSEEKPIAEVIPLIRLPRSLGVFDYLVPQDRAKELAAGTLVRVPFRNRQVPAVVISLQSKSTVSKELRPIEEICLDRFVPSGHLAALLAISEELAVSPASFLFSLVPKIPAKMNPLRRAETVRPRTIKFPPSFIEKIQIATSALQKHTDIFFQIDDRFFLFTLLARLALAAHEQQRHLRILLPTQKQVIALAQALQLHGLPVKRYLPSAGSKERFDLWQQCANDNLPVLVGARSALFFPFPPQSRLCLVDEHREDWKQADKNPRYDVRSLLPLIQKYEKIQIFRTGPVPRLETFYRMSQKQCESRDLRLHAPPSVSLIHTGKSTLPPNASFLSWPLWEALEKTPRTVIFVVKKGKGSVLLCGDCRYLFRCLNCDTPLASHRAFLRCPADKEKIPIPLLCPHCQSSRLRSYGGGTEQFEDDLRAHFPQRVIYRLDRENTRPDTSWQILVGTSALLQFFSEQFVPVPSLNLVVVGEADSLLHRPDFRGQERLASILSELVALARQTHSPMILQTSFPELAVWSIASSHEQTFLETELEERKKFHYPPFGKLIKCIIQSP